jgi:hypothetical protein
MKNKMHENESSKSIKIWIGINKNGKISMHTVEPTRNELTGRWESKYPFCNSVVYNQFADMMKKVGLSWEHDCEFIELAYE